MILTPICRLYSTEQQAQAVVQELTDRGFPSRHVYSLKASDRESADDDTIANNIVSGSLQSCNTMSLLYMRAC